MARFVSLSSGNENVPGQNLGKATNYDDGASQGFFAHGSRNGSPLVVPWWKGRGSPVDFTNPAAQRWLTNQLSNLIAESRVVAASGAKEPAIGVSKPTMAKAEMDLTRTSPGVRLMLTDAPESK